MSSWNTIHYTSRQIKKIEPDFFDRESFQKTNELKGKKPIILPYSVPQKKDTAVILVFFNPTSSIRIQQNILYVVHQLKNASIPFFIGEICFMNEPSLFQESESVYIFRSNSYMFYKENLINQVIRKMAGEKYEKYVIMDADIIFENIDWVDKISDALDKYEVIQPFEYACKLEKNFTVDSVVITICKTENMGHPGYVWAFRRNWFERVGGLFEYALNGGGDTCFTYCFGIAKNIHKIYSYDISNIHQDTIFGYIPGFIYHLPHGIMEKRQYGSRIETLVTNTNKLGIHKLSDAVERNEQGIFEWKIQYRNYMNNILFTYFQNREDDNFN